MLLVVSWWVKFFNFILQGKHQVIEVVDVLLCLPDLVFRLVVEVDHFIVALDIRWFQLIHNFFLCTDRFNKLFEILHTTNLLSSNNPTLPPVREYLPFTYPPFFQAPLRHCCFSVRLHFQQWIHFPAGAAPVLNTGCLFLQHPGRDCFLRLVCGVCSVNLSSRGRNWLSPSCYYHQADEWPL